MGSAASLGSAMSTASAGPLMSAASSGAIMATPATRQSTTWVPGQGALIGALVAFGPGGQPAHDAFAADGDGIPPG